MTQTRSTQARVTESAPDLCRLDAVSLAGLLLRRDVSARETAEIFLDHIEQVNPRWNAIVSLRPRDEILAEAASMDAARDAGAEPGPLFGLPIAIKDLAPVKGLRTTFGSPIFAEFTPSEDAYFVARIRRAGALIIGKTNTPEFGLGSQTYNQVFGATPNAYDRALTSGGSSGGAAAALALRMLPIADGSDFGGSLRNPAAYNNVFGFRPSQDRVAGGPAGDAYMSQLGYPGPMGRTVADAALLLSVMAGRDPRAPLTFETEPDLFAGGLEAPVRGLRIGWLGDLGGRLAMEPGVLARCEAGLSVLKGLGAAVAPATPRFDMERLWSAFVTLRHFGTGGRLKAHYDQPERRALLKPEAVWEIEQALALSALDVYAAAETRTAWNLEMLRLFEEFDFLAAPGSQVFAFSLESHWPAEIAGRSMDSYHRWMEVMGLGTLSGCPIAGAPVGFDERGRSMAVQLIGRPRQDLSVLRLAHALERAGDWSAVAP